MGYFVPAPQIVSGPRDEIYWILRLYHFTFAIPLENASSKESGKIGPEPREERKFQTFLATKTHKFVRI